jgi:hypothetical protein
MQMGFVSFWGGDLRWKLASKRILQQAFSSNQFSNIEIYDRKSLGDLCEPEVLEFIDNNRKGFGYWIWKAPIIIDFINKNPEIDLICYADCGCEFNSSRPALSRWLTYTKELETSDALFFETDCVEREWITRELVQRMDITSVELEQNQIAATAFLMKRDFALDFCQRWYQLMKESNFEFLGSSYDLKNQDVSFKDSRWDQSIFSIMAKRSLNVKTLKTTEENFFAGNWAKGYEFPILTTRNPSRFSIYRVGRIWRVLRLIEKITSKFFSLLMR